MKNISFEMIGSEPSEFLIKKAKTYCIARDKTLAIVTVGEDEASKVYVNNKKKTLEKHGFRYRHIQCSSKISKEEFRDLIEGLNNDIHINGIIVQQPIISETLNKLPKGYINNLVAPEKDVDGLNSSSHFPSCTPFGIIELMKYYEVPFKTKNVVIAGRSELVGKPLAKMLMDYNCTVTIIHSHTANETVQNLIDNCDIFVSAIGKPKYWTKEHFSNSKRKIALIDVGINRDENGKLCGDVSPEVYMNFDYYTPVPKGVGLMTVASLINNLSLTD